MIDYDKTIEEFFNSVVEYMTQRMAKVADTDELAQIKRNVQKVRSVVAGLPQTADYSVRYSKGIVIEPDGLCDKKTRDNRPFQAVAKVLFTLNRYYECKANGWSAAVDTEKQNLLIAIKNWYYVISKCPVKDFLFGFKSPAKFVVRVNQNQR